MMDISFFIAKRDKLITHEEYSYIWNGINDELKEHEFYCNVRGRGLRNSVEYKCDDVHLFSLLLSDLMRNEENIDVL